MSELRLSPHFTLQELCFSPTAVRYGWDNSPNAFQTASLIRLAQTILEPLRIDLDVHITISSGLRCPKLNAAVGGAKDSDHMTGCAADIQVKGISPEQMMERVRKLNLPVKQCINEFDLWTHVSVEAKPSDVPSRQFLRAAKMHGKTVYLDA